MTEQWLLDSYAKVCPLWVTNWTLGEADRSLFWRRAFQISLSKGDQSSLYLEGGCGDRITVTFGPVDV